MDSGSSVSGSGERNPIKSAGKGKTLHSGERRIVYSVYNFLKQLSLPSFRETINFNQAGKLTALAIGRSERLVNEICKEARQSAKVGTEIVFSTPGKERKRKHNVTGLDDFSKDVLRRTVFSYYDKGEYPTALKLTRDLEQKIGYAGSVASTKRILREIGFRYKKTKDGRKFLMEKSDIVSARIKFLRTMHNLRECGDTRPVYYLDETWVNENHSKKYIWQDSKESGGLKVPVGKGGRLIICHVGSKKDGFVKESKWVFRANSASEDYHRQMNAESFKQWFTTFLNLLEEGSIIVMDNAPYHSVLAEKIPSSSWRKNDIQNWLVGKKVPFNAFETKPELLQKVAPFKTQTKVYELDTIANEMGHTVIRLPPYHCQYNPIEMIWAKVKTEVAEKNKTFKIKDVEKLTHDSIDNVSKEDWISRVNHAERLQEEDFVKECVRSDVLENITVNLAEDSDSEFDSDLEHNSESDGDDCEELATILREEREQELARLDVIEQAENPFSKH